MILEGTSMRKKLIFLTLFILFIILFHHFSIHAISASSLQTSNESYISSSETSIKNILIINSYQSGFTWTDNQVSGILSSLSAYDSLYNISIEYMDWKRYPTKANLEQFCDSIHEKYQNDKIDLVITTDDAALAFAFKYRAQYLSNAPILFSGVNKTSYKSLAKGESDFSGVLEHINPVDTVKAALKLNPKLDTVYIINDNSESGIATDELCEEEISKIYPNLNLISLSQMNVTDLKHYISKVSKNSVLLMTTYFQNSEGDFINHHQFCKSIADISPVPVYHLFDFGIDDGVIGGKVISGKTQGALVGAMALKVLNGTNVTSIPVLQKDNTTYTFNYRIMQKFHINVKDLPKNSILTHKPFSFVETYRTLVIVVSLIFVFFILFSISLLVYLHKIRKMKYILSQNNEELSQLYEELTASEEELRSQVTEIIEGNEKLEEYSNKLSYLAYHDTLTGLFNRLYLNEVIEREFEDSTLEGAIFFIDLDNFKYINDTLGHNAGDHLLSSISQKLSSLSKEDIIFVRLGGDEFIFYAKHMSQKQDCKDFANQIIEEFTKPFFILDHYLSITVSIGISRFPADGSTLNVILQNSDMAMYQAKSNGKNGYYFYQPQLKEDLVERVSIETDMKNSLKNGDFKVFYQPQIKIDSYQVDGFEALIRWNSPTLGMLSPQKFIPIAEETGFINSLGEWILDTACKFIKNFNDTYHKQYKISVNISVIQLFQKDFEKIVEKILKESKLESQLLELEITESVIMEYPEYSIEKLNTLRKLGIRIALDDFGTGYSSLSYLKNLPLTTLKIDKSFVDTINKSISGANITDTIIELGHKLHLSIIAEGVENQEQLQYLSKSNCDMIQGFYFSKPLSEEDLFLFLQEQKEVP